MKPVWLDMSARARFGLFMIVIAGPLLEDRASGAPTAAPLISIRDVHSGRLDARTAAAFRAVFGHAGTAPVRYEGFDFDFRPITTVELGRGRVALFSTGVLRNPGHPSNGLNAVHYLARRDGRLAVVGGWFGIGAPGSNGQSASRWGVTRALSRFPVIYSEGGGSWQGCRVSFGVLTELRPAGPVDVTHLLPVFYSNVGMVGEENGATVEGTLVTAIPDRSFTIRYSGSMRFSETYVRRSQGYRPAGGRESRLPGC